MCETLSSAVYYSSFMTEAISCKKAAIVLGFFTYLMHSGITAGIHFLEYRKQNDKLSKCLKAFKLDIEQNSYFFLVFILFMQILTPVPFGVVMLYLYFFLSFPLVFLGHFNPERWWKLRLIGVGLQVVIMLTLIFFVLINPWCRQYYFRYVVAVPPS